MLYAFSSVFLGSFSEDICVTFYIAVDVTKCLEEINMLFSLQTGEMLYVQEVVTHFI